MSARESGSGGERVGAERTLAARQAELVTALVAAGPVPAGFDPDRLSAARRALLRKRAGEAAKAWPQLAASIGNEWPAVFARHRDGASPVGPLRDGWDVARTLRAERTLAPRATAELAARERALRYDGSGDPRPRRTARLRRIVAAIRTRLRAPG